MAAVDAAVQTLRAVDGQGEADKRPSTRDYADQLAAEHSTPLAARSSTPSETAATGRASAGSHSRSSSCLGIAGADERRMRSSPTCGSWRPSLAAPAAGEDQRRQRDLQRRDAGAGSARPSTPDARPDRCDLRSRCGLPGDRVVPRVHIPASPAVRGDRRRSARPQQPFQKAVMLIGPGGTGKSTAASLIRALIGPENVSRRSRSTSLRRTASPRPT